MAIVVSDTFTRANGATLGNAETGQPWTLINGTYSISSNKAAATTGGANSLVIVDVGEANPSITVKVTSTGNGAGIAFRVTDLSNYFRFHIRNDGFTTLQKIEAGATVSLYSATLTYTAGMELKVVLSGSSITVYTDGVSRSTVTNAFNSAVTKHGLYSNFTGTTHDDFVLETSGVAGTPGSVSYATKQIINRTASTAYATKQAINQTASVAFATKQTISQVGSIAYATQQTITDGGSPGSIAYSTKQIISLTASLLAATRQTIYQAGSSEWATKQSIIDFVEIVKTVNLLGEWINSVSLQGECINTVSLQGEFITSIPLLGEMINTVALEGEI